MDDSSFDSLVSKDASGAFAAGYGPGWTTVLSSAGGYSSTGVNVNLQTVLQLSSAHACMDRIASDVAKLPIKLLKQQGAQYVRVHDHYLLDLLKRPNSRQTGYEMRYQMVFSYQILGNAYGVIILGPEGIPKAIIPMPVGKPTSIIEKMNGSIEYICTNQLFRQYKTSKPQETTARRTITEEEMIHLRRQSLDGVRGTSAISTASELFGLGLAAQALAARTFRNGATFGFIICSPIRLNPEQVAQTQNDFIRNQGGVDNSGKPPIMHSGTTIEKISMTPAEVQLLEARSHIDAEICRVLGVPHAILGIATGAGSDAYKNLESDMRSYVDGTLLNILTPFEELLNQRLLFDPNSKTRIPEGGARRGDYRFEFDTSALLRADKQARYLTYQTGVTAHVLTPNEARAEEGFPPTKTGDDFPESAKTINLNRTSPKADDDEPDILPDADTD
jgi:HK97 family phage portal protein